MKLNLSGGLEIDTICFAPYFLIPRPNKNCGKNKKRTGQRMKIRETKRGKKNQKMAVFERYPH